MPFSTETKARLFIRSARICCLCFKPCGTNIEAAHIVAEADGGANEDDNGIPLCLDCHQEVGAYDKRHPLGNKFTEIELRARRDQLYRLVESGSIQAQVIAGRLHDTVAATARTLPPQPHVDQQIKALAFEPSPEAKSLLENLIARGRFEETFPRKLEMLGDRDRAWILDELVRQFANGAAIDALMVVAAAAPGKTESMLVMEQVLRRVTLTGDVQVKARFMNAARVDLLCTTDAGLRVTFFTDVVSVMEQDQYDEVNFVTPAAVKVQGALPKELRTRYVRALLSQARSGAYRGAPAAQAALKELPAELRGAALEMIDLNELMVRIGDEHLRELIKASRSIWPEESQQLYGDFVKLGHHGFREKYWKAWLARIR